MSRNIEIVNGIEQVGPSPVDGMSRQPRVIDYKTGAALDGMPSAALLKNSRNERTGTGAVGAYRDKRGVWRYVKENDARRTHTVYVEEA